MQLIVKSGILTDFIPHWRREWTSTQNRRP